MIFADDYAPTSAIVGVIVIGAALCALGGAICVRPRIGWAIVRLRMSRPAIAEAKQARGDRGLRVLGVVTAVGGVVVILVGVGRAVFF